MEPLRALRRQLWLLAFFDEFIPFYALFALWFRDNGISVGRISLILAVWAIVALVLEIPSGALADRIDRRRLIASAYVCRMSAISLWLVWPSLSGILIGTVLWAIHDALASGAWEAMIYDELDAYGAADSYTQLMARLAQAAWVAIGFSAVAAWALVGPIGIEGVGWTSVAALVVAIVLVLRVPRAAASSDGGDGLGGIEDDEPTTYGAWLATLKRGVRVARTVPVLGRLVVLGALVETMTVFEEYIPLLADWGGATEQEVPVILGIAWFGFIVGAEVAARRPDLSAAAQAGFLGVAVVIAFVAVRGEPGPWVVVSFSLSLAAVQTTMVLADARLQSYAESDIRATVTSVKGFLTGALFLVGFSVVGVLGDGDDVRPGLFVMLVPLVLTAFLTLKWMPPPVKQESTRAAE